MRGTPWGFSVSNNAVTDMCRPWEGYAIQATVVNPLPRGPVRIGGKYMVTPG